MIYSVKKNIRKASNLMTLKYYWQEIINNLVVVANKMPLNICSGSLIDLIRKNLSLDKVPQDISTINLSIDLSVEAAMVIKWYK